MASKVISKAARDEAADQGYALPDGSYPIRNKGELMRAIMSYGRAKNPAATKVHIIKRAKALGAAKMLPTNWASSGPELKHSDLENIDEWTVGDHLLHHGVKGMHWGVRKDRTASLTVRHPDTAEVHTIHFNPKRVRVETNEKGEKTLSGDRKEVEHIQRSAAKALAKKPGKAKMVSQAPIIKKHATESATAYAQSHKQMSDEELRTRLNRLKMETEYAKLTAPPESTGSKVKKAAGKAVGNAASTVAQQTLTKVGSAAVEQLVLPKVATALAKAAAKRAVG